MFGDALSTPARTSDSAVTLFIGGVLTLLAVVGPLVAVAALSVTPLALLLVPLAVLPVLVLRGYYVAVLAGGANREPGAPSLVRWGKLLSDGVKSVLVSVGYLLPAVLLVGLALAALVALVPPEVTDPNTTPSAVESSTSDARALGVLAVFVLGGLLLLGYALLYAYLRPAALAVFAVSGSLREAFRLGRVRSVAGTGDFAVGWLLAGLVLVVGGLFALPLSVLLVGFFLLFYLQVVAHSLYGRAASDVLVPRPTTGDADEDSDEEGADADTDTGESSPDDGFPSEWGATSTNAEDSGDDGTDTAAARTADAADDAGEEVLTDWDDVTAAVESADAEEASTSDTAAGGVSAAVQSGRGVPMDDARGDKDDSKTVTGDDALAPDGINDTDSADDSEAVDDTETGDTDASTDPADPFDWGPTDER
jgi:hypothetical protein